MVQRFFYPGKALAAKKASWKVRSELRSGELAAISKAIYILHNDGARDLFKKSFSSQFLQVQQTSHMAKSESASVALRLAASRSGDERVLKLAALVAKPSGPRGKRSPELYEPSRASMR